tara:strand:+ start:214 stop:441 length:228 start_codon:yes stop_codon:yes gene_type:complete
MVLFVREQPYPSLRLHHLHHHLHLVRLSTTLQKGNVAGYSMEYPRKITQMRVMKNATLMAMASPAVTLIKERQTL